MVKRLKFLGESSARLGLTRRCGRAASDPYLWQKQCFHSCISL